ncbi:uncharacterized protein B0P05DRAFT_452202, partial [Gilbertella persicaria]|uniref:uncharacterized protein n=1 Tax=Gilbertella persicaria TaxID=101096 RepID=UPI002220CDC2
LFLNFTSNLCPQKSKTTKKEPSTSKEKIAAIKVNGVNILNRKNLDSKTIVERIKKRRENHNYVERRRRDCINHTIDQLSQVVPHTLSSGQRLNKHHVLKAALNHILV